MLTNTPLNSANRKRENSTRRLCFLNDDSGIVIREHWLVLDDVPRPARQEPTFCINASPYMASSYPVHFLPVQPQHMHNEPVKEIRAQHLVISVARFCSPPCRSVPNHKPGSKYNSVA